MGKIVNVEMDVKTLLGAVDVDDCAGYFACKDLTKALIETDGYESVLDAVIAYKGVDVIVRHLDNSFLEKYAKETLGLIEPGNLRESCAALNKQREENEAQQAKVAPSNMDE